jgi:acetyl esterase/lipase
MRTRIFARSFLAAALIAGGAQAAPVKPAPAKPAAAKPVSAKTAARPAPAKAKHAKTDTTAKAPTGPAPTHDVIYATLTGFRPLTLDLYLPPHKPKDFPKPLLVFVHGGNWNSGDARHGGGFDDFPGVLTALAAKGYVVAGVNYRLSGEARFPAALQDVKSAIRWLRSHADDYNIDTTRVAVWGEEAGGQIAALVGTSCGVTALEPAGDAATSSASDCVQAVIDWHGISDLAAMAQDSDGAPRPAPTPEGAYLGCEPSECAAGVVHATTPMAYITSNAPPFLLQQGAHKAVPLAQSQKLYDALQAMHIPSELVVYADGDPDVAKKSIDKIEDFLAQTFPARPVSTKPVRRTSKALPY